MESKKEGILKLSFAVITFGVATYFTKLYLKALTIYSFVTIAMLGYVWVRCGWYSVKTVWNRLFGGIPPEEVPPPPKEK